MLSALLPNGAKKNDAEVVDVLRAEQTAQMDCLAKQLVEGLARLQAFFEAKCANHEARFDQFDARLKEALQATALIAAKAADARCREREAHINGRIRRFEKAWSKK